MVWFILKLKKFIQEHGNFLKGVLFYESFTNGGKKLNLGKLSETKIKYPINER